MNGRHLRYIVAPDGTWRRLNGTVTDNDRGHIIPTDDIGRRYIAARRKGGTFFPIGQPGWVTVEGQEILGLRLYDTDSTGIERVLEIADTAAERLEAEAHSPGDGGTAASESGG